MPYTHNTTEVKVSTYLLSNLRISLISLIFGKYLKNIILKNVLGYFKAFNYHYKEAKLENIHLQSHQRSTDI